jgi:hypothetical protein
LTVKEGEVGIALLLAVAGDSIELLMEVTRGRDEDEAEKEGIGHGGGKDPKAWFTLSMENCDDARLMDELAPDDQP